MTHDTHTHTPPPYLGGCEEDLSNERRGLLHRGQTYTHTHTQTDIETESAQWADSVKTIFYMLRSSYENKDILLF